MTHPLTDEMCESIIQNCDSFAFQNVIWFQSMRASYDFGYAQALEDLQDVITSIQRKDSPSIPITLKELEAMRPQVVNLPQANSDVCGEEGIERARQQTFEENDELMRKLSDS